MEPASATRISIPVDKTGLLNVKQTPEAASTVSRLLQEDLEVS